MRHRFEDININILNWKINQKNNSIRTWSSRKQEFLSKVTPFLPLKFECANYIIPIPRTLFTFHVPEEYWSGEFFAKIIGGNYVFIVQVILALTLQATLISKFIT